MNARQSRLVVVALAATACREPTQLLVHVDSNVDGVTDLEVEVLRADVVKSSAAVSIGNGPASFGLVPDGPHDEPRTIRIRPVGDPNTDAVDIVIPSFVSNETRHVYVCLSSGCDCNVDAVCTDDGCTSALHIPETNERSEWRCGPFDAGDGGVPTDAGPSSDAGDLGDAGGDLPDAGSWSWALPGWKLRRQIRLSADSGDIQAGQIVRLTFAEDLILQAQTNRQDLRMRFNGAERVSLNIASDPGPTGTVSMFIRTHAPILRGRFDDRYHLYYGNSLATSEAPSVPDERYAVQTLPGPRTLPNTTPQDILAVTASAMLPTDHWLVVTTWQQRATSDNNNPPMVSLHLNNNAAPLVDDIGFGQAIATDKTLAVWTLIDGATGPRTITMRARSRLLGSNPQITNARLVAFLIPGGNTADLQTTRTRGRVEDAAPVMFNDLQRTVGRGQDHLWLARALVRRAPGSTHEFLRLEDAADSPYQQMQASVARTLFTPFFHVQLLRPGPEAYRFFHQPGDASERSDAEQVMFRTDGFETVDHVEGSNRPISTTAWVDTMTLITQQPHARRDVVYLGVAGIDYGGPNLATTVEARIRKDTTTVGSDHLRSTQNTFQPSIFPFVFAETTGREHTLDMQMRIVGPGRTADVTNQHLLALWYVDPAVLVEEAEAEP